MKKLQRIFLTLAAALGGHLTLSAQNAPLSVEAESGVSAGTPIAGAAQGDWAIGAVPAAGSVPAITYVTTLTDGGGTAPGTANRVLSYTLTFPAAGTYELYARVRVGPAGANDDSFYYGTGFGSKGVATATDWTSTNNIFNLGYTTSTQTVEGAGSAATGVWKWLNLSKYSFSGQPLVTYTVPAGSLTQTFQIGARENGLDIDKFVFGAVGQYFTVANLDAGVAGTAPTPPQPYTPSGPPMATGKPKFLGGIWSPAQLNNFTAYWNQVVPSNVGKWGSVEGTRNVFTWTDLDAAYKLAKDNGFPFRFHVLTWGAQQPTWMAGLSPADQLMEIKQWYAAVAARYPDIDFIEVVNEALHQPPGTSNAGGDYVNALGGNGATGYDWVLNAFRLARQYFPNTRLMINDYSVENSVTNANRYLAIIRLLQRENLLDAIGIQGHSFSTYPTSSAVITNSLNVLASSGLPMYITELDIHGDGTSNDDATQLAEYQRVFPLFWTHPSIKGMSLFGYLPGTDANSFLAYANGAERPALTWLKGYVSSTALPCNVATTARLTNPSTASATNGAINLMAQGGGTAAYTYSWTGPNGFTATTEDLTGLAPGTYTVVVTAPSSTCSTTSQIVLEAMPSLTSFASTSGPVGATVVLTGTNLTNATAVTFNGTAASGFVVNSATQITVNVPMGTISGPITVTTPGGSVTSATAFTVTRPLTTWTGLVSNDWFTASNWTAGVPTAETDALLAAGSPAYPAIASGAANVFSLTIASGATLGQSGGTLNLSGNLLANGGFAPTGGTVATMGATAQTLGGSGLLALQNLSVGAAGAGLGTAASLAGILTLTGDLATNGQPLMLRSSMSGGVMTDALVVNSGGGVIGQVTVQRAIDPSLNAGPGYRHFAPPVNYTTVADLATTSTGGSFVPVINPAYNSAAVPATVTPFPTVLKYDNTLLNKTNNLSSFDKGWVSPTSLTDVLTAGNGVTVNIGASETVDFQGTLNTGDFVVTILSSRVTYPTDGGWRLLGNPYPSPLNLSLVANDLYLMENAMYTYSSTSQYTGQYRSYVNRVGNSTLPMGQGFFMRVGAGNSNGTVTFRNSQRLTMPTTAATFQRTTAETRPLVQLTLQGAGSSLLDETTVYFEQGATSGFDTAYDAEKLSNPNGLNLASVTAGVSQAINGLPLLSGPTTVPLTVGVPTTGTYTLQAATLVNLNGKSVYLLDALTGQQIDLKQQSSYSFSASNAALIAGRFSLVFGQLTALATQPSFTAASVSVFPNPTHEQFTVRVPAVSGASQASLQLYNMLGQSVRETTLALPATGVQASFDVVGLPVGVYVLRVKAGDTTVAKQVIIN
jgi:endo-1,4-beta-xylanase